MDTNKKKWIVFTAVYLASVAVCMCQWKVPPIMPLLIKELDVSMTTAGWLMSIFALAGIVLAIPAAVLLGKLGPKMAGLIALGCSTLGSIVGALAGNAMTMLVSRLIEGIGLGLIVVIAPAVISMWFPPEKLGLPMGIYVTWVSAGLIIIFNVANPLVNLFGWPGVWWFTAIICFGALAFYALVVDNPSKEGRTEEYAASEKVAFYGEMLFNPASWVLAFAFMCYCFSVIGGLFTWEPFYLTKVWGLGAEKSSFMVSLIEIVAFPTCIIVGAILDRIKRRQLFLSWGMLVLGVGLFWSFRIPGESIVIPYMVVLGIVVSFPVVAIFTLCPDTVKNPELSGLAFGILTIGQNAGMLIGPPVVGSLIESHGWGVGGTSVLIAVAIGLVASFFVKTKRAAPKAEELCFLLF